MDEDLRKLRSENCPTPQYVIDLRNYLPRLDIALKNINGLEYLCFQIECTTWQPSFTEEICMTGNFINPHLQAYIQAFFDFLVSRYEVFKSIVVRLKSSQSGGIPSGGI